MHRATILSIVFSAFFIIKARLSLYNNTLIVSEIQGIVKVNTLFFYIFQKNNIKKTISKDFDIEFNLNDKNVEYEFEILSEDSNITGNKWEEDFNNKEFPIELLKIELLTKGESTNIQYYQNKNINHQNHIIVSPYYQINLP